MGSKTTMLTTFDRARLQVVLFEALSEVLEMLAYTCALDDAGPEVVAGEGHLTAVIPVYGPGDGASGGGRISVSTTRGIAVRIAAAMSGLDDLTLAADPELLDDAVRETANVVAGVFLRRAVTGGQYRLGLPVIVPQEARRPLGREGLALAVSLLAIDGPIGAELELCFSGSGGLAGEQPCP